jgi:hypothetical protein
MVSIVQVNVSLLQAPAPSLLQQTGALISQGGTNAAVNSLTLLTQFSDLTALQPAGLAKGISTINWSGGTATITAGAPHGMATFDTVMLTIMGAVPAGYNGTYLCTITGSQTFTYQLPVNPGPGSSFGAYQPASVNELRAMATTYFAQGTMQSIYVLELGLGGASDGVTALTAWIQNNPQTVYSFLVPRAWDNNASFLSMLASFEAPTAMTYFWVTTTPSTYTSYTDQMKCVVAMVEAPGIPALEFSLAGALYWALSYRPGPLNRVSPFCFQYVFGVTPYPLVGNGALLTAFKASNTNVIGTGAEGGLSNTMLLWGVTGDGRDFSYWYSVDYTQINAHIVLANEVINGANNRINPLFYDQHGINRLQARLTQLMSNEITFGLAVGTVIGTELDGLAFQQALDSNEFTAQAVVNAIPFVAYAGANPSDYKIGRYAGLTIVYIPQRGFTSIVLNLVVSDFLTF